TETVYGLGADATNGAGVAHVFDAKGRPSFNPLIAHVADMPMAERYGVFDETARHLASLFWPGPLTLVVPHRADSAIHPLVTAGNEAVALRVPTGPVQALAKLIDRPIAAPSANRSGRISATTAQDVANELGEAVPLILDGGPTAIGLESTIIGVEKGTLRLLRPGGLAVEQIAAKSGMPVATLRPAEAHDDANPAAAPGMLTSHYAPSMPVRLNAVSVSADEAYLTFGGQMVRGAGVCRLVVDLSPQGDLVEAAASLFAAMRRVDQSGASAMAVAPIPQTGLGLAINDRLKRAAAPRNTMDARHG
ncbi:MAG: L-threonylcarbamoyladenylate synthase, partial [Pseudomonadota bacterium]